MSLTELIEEHMLPLALKCGIDIRLFYDYTLKEIKLLIKAYNDRISDNLKIQAQMDYTSNLTLANFIGTMLSKDSKPPEFEELYSFLYTDEEVEEIQDAKERAEQERQMKIQQAYWKAFAEQFNAKQDAKELELKKDSEGSGDN